MKVNLVEVAFGTATDPYQPIEGHYKLTRRSLQELSRNARCTIYMSVPAVDEQIWRELEPGTAITANLVKRRFNALRQKHRLAARDGD